MNSLEETGSLKEAAAACIVSNLGRLADSIECSFSCGGSLPVSASNTLIFYKRDTDEWSSRPIHLPSVETTDIEELLKACSTATFGIGSETVTDKSYRDALKLEPESFTTNFNLASTSILNRIAKLMTGPIKAELYKLNVYLTGGHFKSHVDTPCSKDMFGSLVICLPAAFTGGELVTYHQKRKVVFDWSVLSRNQIQWAAFYSDVEHEVLPVTSGYRITLTYNLYTTAEVSVQRHSLVVREKIDELQLQVMDEIKSLRDEQEHLLNNQIQLFAERPRALDEADWLVRHAEWYKKYELIQEKIEQLSEKEDRALDKQIQLTKEKTCLQNEEDQLMKEQYVDPEFLVYDVSTSPLYWELLAALGNPHFMRGGGVLGFCCQYRYVDTINNLDRFAVQLKGADAIIYTVAKRLGLKIEMRPVVINDDEGRHLVLDKFREFECDENCGPIDHGDLSQEEVMQIVFETGEFDDDITWCHNPDEHCLEPAGTTMKYGNDATQTLFYQAASLLITVPKFSSTRVAMSNEKSQESKEQETGEKDDEKDDQEDDEPVAKIRKVGSP